MLDIVGDLSKRDKAILIGLFLSKFDRRVLGAFGFSGFKEAFNVFGYSVATSPNSIKNYRDEFDPYFPNGRNGWHKREIREYCRNIMQKTKDLSFEEFYAIICSIITEGNMDVGDIRESDIITKDNGLVQNRLITGKAAEEYFVRHYNAIGVFQNYELKDTTNLGCGFDYKLTNGSSNFYIEVKGIKEKQGSILMTEKEHAMAGMLQDRYCLFVVSNFREAPTHQLFFNPLKCKSLNFQRQERQVVQVSYSAVVPFDKMVNNMILTADS